MCPANAHLNGSSNGHARNGHVEVEEAVEYCVHTSLCFDPKKMEWMKNVTFTVNRDTGLIVRIEERPSADADVGPEDKDLRGKVVLPGMVDAHTHIFLHAYA